MASDSARTMVTFRPHYLLLAGRRRGLRNPVPRREQPATAGQASAMVDPASPALCENWQVVLARLATMRPRERADLGQPANLPLVPRAQVAALLGVSRHSLRSAETAQSLGRLAELRAVQLGALSVTLAANLARQEPVFQEEVVQRGNDDMRPAYPSARAMPAGVVVGKFEFAEASQQGQAGQINLEGDK